MITYFALPANSFVSSDVADMIPNNKKTQEEKKILFSPTNIHKLALL